MNCRAEREATVVGSWATSRRTGSTGVPRPDYMSNALYHLACGSPLSTLLRPKSFAPTFARGSLASTLTNRVEVTTMQESWTGCSSSGVFTLHAACAFAGVAIVLAAIVVLVIAYGGTQRRR